VDPVLTVQCVHESDVAWHCPGANRRGIGIELCGRSDQSPEQWADPMSEGELRQASVLAARICQRWGIPIVRLTPEAIQRGEHGIAGHMDFTVAFKTPGGHHDPGPDFPWQHFMDLVREAADYLAPA
jgi:N-acetyl-anhydromuramyl-L-alanine amidase AmpD